jgi:hypothetical protein
MTGGRVAMGRPKPVPKPTKPKPLFTCGHCGRDVYPGRYQGEEKPRNHCPFCLWSKHVSVGGAVYPPCGAMICGVSVGDDQIVWRCLGCGFTVRAYSDDAMFRQFERAGAFGKTFSLGGTLFG